MGMVENCKGVVDGKKNKKKEILQKARPNISLEAMPKMLKM
jgi:hypothetical protein